MSKKMGSMGIILNSVIILSLISAGIAFFITLNKQASLQDKEESTAANLVQKNVNTKKIDEMSIAEILNNVDELYLESYNGAREIVELSKEDVEEVVAFLKNLGLKKVKESTGLQEESYLYALHIKSKHLKMNISEANIWIENAKEEQVLFQVDMEKQEDLKKKLEEIYMKKYNGMEIFLNPQSVTVEAKDEGKSWSIDKGEIQSLLDCIELLSPVEGVEVVGLPGEYPDYHIHITTDKEYHLRLINKEYLTVESPDQYVYYRYDSELWEYVSKKYPIQMRAQSSELTYLLKSSAIVVDDLEDQYDLEDSTYYHITIPRWLLRTEKEKVEHFKEDDTLAFQLNFTVNGSKKEMKIYQNHIIYGNEIYYSERIGESVRSLLTVP